MRVRDFLALTEALAAPPPPPAATTRIAFGFVQVIFEDPRVHYECWAQRRTAALEVGLHFEGPREFSYAWLTAIAAHLPAVHAALGPEPAPEAWTERWARLHERWDAPDLTDDLAARAAARLVAYVDTLQPLVESIAPTLPAQIESAVAADRRRPHRMDELPPDFRG